MKIHVYDSTDDLEDAAAAMIAESLQAFGNPVTFGLAGGTTPKATYRRLRERDLDWTAVTAWLGDERWVPPDHPDSNARMARETLLDHIPAHFEAPEYGDHGPKAAALEYERRLDRLWCRRNDEGPAPDLVLLGLGDDGHTASLFPETAALEERERRYVANWVPKLEAWRLTATLPLLWSARMTMFLVAGEHKARVVAEILEAGVPYPAALVSAGSRNVHWLLDAAAASALSQVPHD